MRIRLLNWTCEEHSLLVCLGLSHSCWYSSCKIWNLAWELEHRGRCRCRTSPNSGTVKENCRGNTPRTRSCEEMIFSSFCSLLQSLIQYWIYRRCLLYTCWVELVLTQTKGGLIYKVVYSIAWKSQRSIRFRDPTKMFKFWKIQFASRIMEWNSQIHKGK